MAKPTVSGAWNPGCHRGPCRYTVWSRQGGDQSVDGPTEGRGRSIPGSGTPDKLLEPGEQKLPGDHQTRPDGKHEKRWAGARRQEPVG